MHLHGLPQTVIAKDGYGMFGMVTALIIQEPCQSAPKVGEICHYRLRA